jgi:anti-sigma B factor antagonist
MKVIDPDEHGSLELPDPDFRLIVSARGDRTLVVAQGELDLATAPDLETVLAAQTGPVAVDLRELSFVDATGLRVLLQAEARSREDGKNLRFIPGQAVRRLFDLAGVPDPLTYIEPPRS